MAKRYQRGNHNQYIKEQQKTQWPKDTKGVIIICISKKKVAYSYIVGIVGVEYIENRNTVSE
jgi:hypothetical protein